MVTHRVARKRWRKVVLAVTDQKNSVRYFVDVPGFQPEWRNEEHLAGTYPRWRAADDWRLPPTRNRRRTWATITVSRICSWTMWMHLHAGSWIGATILHPQITNCDAEDHQGGRQLCALQSPAGPASLTDTQRYIDKKVLVGSRPHQTFSVARRNLTINLRDFRESRDAYCRPPFG